MRCGFLPFYHPLPPATPDEESPRRRFIVVTVAQEPVRFERGRAVEAEWAITLRPATGDMTPRFLLRVAQRPDLPAPYRSNDVVEIAPCLLEEVKS